MRRDEEKQIAIIEKDQTKALLKGERKMGAETDSRLQELFKRYETLLFFDVETTGFDARSCQIIELAAIRMDRDGYKRKEDVLVKLPEGKYIPKEITELTHITDLMLERDGVAEKNVAALLAGLILGGQTLMIAHNAQFDLNFVGWLFVKFRQEYPAWLDAFNRADYLDTLTVYKDRRAYPHKLESAITAYRLEDTVKNSHRAIDDVEALLEVCRSMDTERPDLHEYINIFGFNSKYGISGSRLKKISYHSQRFRDYMAAPEQTLPAIIKRERGKTA